jgi:hypothetical protein
MYFFIFSFFIILISIDRIYVGIVVGYRCYTQRLTCQVLVKVSHNFN